MAPSVAVIIPPMCNLNAPYAAAPQLAGWLWQQGARVHQFDASLATALRLFSRPGLHRVFDAIVAGPVPEDYAAVVANRGRYERLIEPIVAFLQGREPSLAGRLVRQAALPAGPRFAACDAEAEAVAFGRLGQTDQARWLATLALQDLADLIRLTVAPHFALTSYGSRIAESASSFDPLAEHLAAPPDVVEQLLIEVLAESLPRDLDLVALTCPFPGNLPAALRIGQWLRRERPGCRILLGGGYPSTELRDLADPRIFDCVDAVVLDDGEAPLARWLAIATGSDLDPVNSFVRESGTVRWYGPAGPAPRHGELPAPCYTGLPLDRYLDLLDSWNPMHRMWNEGRWLKLMAAHGCYWSRCTFCDTSLPYIGDFQPARARTLADRMDALAAETGRSGFHFTDEAAPPSLLLRLAVELLRRERSYHWWGNIRFDDFFTADRCRVLAAAGLVAVSGGIEVAEPRVLERVGKGVDLPQLCRVCHAFAAAGVLVHGYLMYGFPGQTLQETIDSAEIVRQLFAAGILHSGFWHRFTATAHAPIGRDPAAFGIQILGPPFAGFARNNLEHHDPHGADADRLGPALAACLDLWMQTGETAVQLHELDPDLPAPSVAPDQVARWMAEPAAAGDRPCWLGEEPTITSDGLALVDEHGDAALWELPEDLVDQVASGLRSVRPAHWPEKGRVALPGSWPEDLLDELHEHGLVWI